jgi:hypothetical protein
MPRRPASRLAECCDRDVVLLQMACRPYAQAAQPADAREEAAVVLQIQPDYTIQGMAKHFSPFRRSEDAKHHFDGLRKAGLPED